MTTFDVLNELIALIVTLVTALARKRSHLGLSPLYK